MPAYFQSNLAEPLDAVCRRDLTDVIGERAGDWVITVTERVEFLAWDVAVDGPNGFEWGKRFGGAERQVDLVAQSIGKAVALPEMDLATALADLANAGIDVTCELEGGETVYIIDRIRLHEDALLHLKNIGALTVEGIRQHLLDRAA